LEAFHGLSLLQLCLVGALGLGLGYWTLGLGFQFIRRAALTALLAIAAAMTVVRLALPGTFCAVVGRTRSLRCAPNRSAQTQPEVIRPT
jgi:hypothetical protein